MIKKTKSAEFDHFNQLASEWWSESGKFRILHDIKPIRLKYIIKNLKNKKINDLKILDIGCGGGLICEPLAKLGAKITGIDFVEKNIKVAKLHALENNLKINYIVGDINKIKLKQKYDVVILFEVLEHVEDWGKTLSKIKTLMNKGGVIIISTINRNILSKIFAIKLAENFLTWIPKNTHDYNKFITTEELKTYLIQKNFSILDFSGLVFNIIDREWKLSKKNKLINYFCTAKIN